MNPFLATIDLSQLSVFDGFAVEGINPNFGNGVGSGGAVSPAGDLNGDGIGDFVIGAERGVSLDPVTGQQRFTAGEVYVVFGAPGLFPASVDPAALDGTNGFRLLGGREALGLGFSVSAAGDVNGDGIDDLLLGSRATDLGQSAEPGEAFVVFGRTSGFAPAQEIYTLQPGEGFRLVDPNPSVPGQFGRSVTDIGDFNGDGIGDFAVGEAKSPNPFQPGNIEPGAVHVILGDAGGFPSSGTPGQTPLSITYYGPLDQAGLGTSVSGIGDFNGDGLDDLIAVAPGAPFRSPTERFATVIFGTDTVPASGNFAQDLTFLPQDASAGFHIRDIGDLATVAANAGDVNGDGLDDIIMGAPNGNVAYVIYGTQTPDFNFFPTPATLDGTTGFVINGETAGDAFGGSVHAAGDINNDGYDDVIVGAFRANRTPVPNSTSVWLGGAAYVVFGGPNLAASIDAATLDGTDGFSIEGISPFSVNPDDAVGTAVSGGTDINGDGIDDVIIGAPDATSAPGNVQTTRAGRTYVIYGKDTSVAPPGYTFEGTPQADNLDGGPGGDLLRGLAGNDVLRGFGGDDVLEGGPGADDLNGGAGIDLASYAGSGAGVTVDLGTGAAGGGHASGDTFTGIEGVIGSAQADTLRGTGAANTLRGRGGDDLLIGRGGGDELDGGNGRDTASYATASAAIGFDRLNPALGAGDAAGDTLISIERIVGSGFNDDIRGAALAETLEGGAGNDRLIGRGQSDLLIGGAGNDILLGGGGPDVLIGGAGADFMRGDAGIDTASFADATSAVTADFAAFSNNSGEASGDQFFLIENMDGSDFGDDLRGDAEDNHLRGRDGNDTLRGRGGDDLLEGGRGADVLIGQGGADMFLFTGPNQGVDTINDFASGIDSIAVLGGAFGGLPSGALPAGRLAIGAAAGDANDRFIYNDANGRLFFDADGSGAGAAKLLAVLAGAPTLTAADIEVV